LRTALVLGTAIKEQVDDLSDILDAVTQLEMRLFKYAGVTVSRTLNVRTASFQVTRRSTSKGTAKGAPREFVTVAAAPHESTSSADVAGNFVLSVIISIAKGNFNFDFTKGALDTLRFFYALSDVWKVSVITGVYEPEEDQEETESQTGEDGREEEQGEEAAEEEQGEEAPEEEQEEAGEEDDGNTNNNALNRSEKDEAKINDAKQNRNRKYKTAPKPPTCGIVIVLYGDRGKTQILPLLSSSPDGVSNFQPGNADEFKVSSSLVV